MLQNRKRQEKLQKERRNKDLLALTMVTHGHNYSSDGRDGSKLKMLKHDSLEDDRRHIGKRSSLIRSDSSDNIPTADSRVKHHIPPPAYHLHHLDLPEVHGDSTKQQKLKHSNNSNDILEKKHPIAAIDRNDVKKEDLNQKLERVHKVEQTTVHTVITTHEKIQNKNSNATVPKHLPSLTNASEKIHNTTKNNSNQGVHSDVKEKHDPHISHGGISQYPSGGIRKSSISGSGGGSDSGLSRMKTTLSGRRNSGGTGVSHSQGGVSHLKSLMRQDSNDNNRAGI